MFCTNCGHDNPDGAKFCGNCRNSFGTANEPIISDDDLPQQNERKNSLSAKIIYILLFIWSAIPLLGGLSNIPESAAIYYLVSSASTVLAGYIRLKILTFLSIGTNKLTLWLTITAIILFGIGLSLEN